MRQLTLVLLLCVLPFVPEIAHSQTATPQVAASVQTLVRTLTNPRLPWKKRDEAETALTKLPPEPVLLALVPEIAKGMPSSFGIANSLGSAKADSGLPPSWQIFYGVGRVWQYQSQKSFANGSARIAVGQALVAVLPTARSPYIIYIELGEDNSGYWYAGAEAPLFALARSNKTKADLRIGALNSLLGNTGAKYYPTAKQITQTWPQQTMAQVNSKTTLVQMLIEWNMRRYLRGHIKPSKARSDPELLRIGFSLLPVLERQRKGNGYILAESLGNYVGKRFAPDSRRLGSQNQSTPEFFSKAAANALAWWKAQNAKT